MKQPARFTKVAWEQAAAALARHLVNAHDPRATQGYAGAYAIAHLLWMYRAEGDAAVRAALWHAVGNGDFRARVEAEYAARSPKWEEEERQGRERWEAQQHEARQLATEAVS